MYFLSGVEAVGEDDTNFLHDDQPLPAIRLRVGTPHRLWRMSRQTAQRPAVYSLHRRAMSSQSRRPW